VNYGFNVKYNKNKTNLQGHANVIFRVGTKVYQIKSNAIQSLYVQAAGCTPSSTCPNKATFQSKANLTEITDPLNPIGLGGNHTLVIAITDKGEPGSFDTISVTLYGSGGGALLFSSNWNGTATIEQPLGGGNLVVH